MIRCMAAAPVWVLWASLNRSTKWSIRARTTKRARARLIDCLPDNLLKKVSKVIQLNILSRDEIVPIDDQLERNIQLFRCPRRIQQYKPF